MAKVKMPKKYEEPEYQDLNTEGELMVFDVMVIAERLNLRENPSLFSNVLKILTKNTVLTVDDYDNKWYHTVFSGPNGESIDGYLVKVFTKRV